MGECEIVAELGASHRGSLETALKLLITAHQVGATCFKLQTWTPGTMVIDRETLVLDEGPWKGRALAELYEQALLPWADQVKVFEYAKTLGIECFSSVFDLESLARLESVGCPRYKIASFELVDIPLIEAVAKTRKPIILSTGMATLPEIEEGLQAARRGGARDITLLKCTSAYPADPIAVNLRGMDYLRGRFRVKVGLSDHTRGPAVPIAAAAIGAEMLEKHIGLNDQGLDGGFAMPALEFAAMVQGVTDARRALGVAHFGVDPDEEPQLLLRRSLYFTRDLPAGATLVESDIRSARPARGLPPRLQRTLTGAKLARGVKGGQPVSWQDIVQPTPTR